MLCLELEAYSERWHIQNPSIFRNMTYLEIEAYSENCQTSTMEFFAKKWLPSALKKSSYIFGKWNFLALVLRNFLYFLKRNLF